MHNVIPALLALLTLPGMLLVAMTAWLGLSLRRHFASKGRTLLDSEQVVRLADAFMSPAQREEFRSGLEMNLVLTLGERPVSLLSGAQIADLAAHFPS